MSEHQPTGQHAPLMTSSEWSTVPAPGTRVLLTGAGGGLGRALSAALNEAAAGGAGAGIRANAVVPGLAATPKGLGLRGSARDRLLAGVPMRRVAALAEVVGPVLYLLSPAAGYMTGQALRLDGGAGLGQAGLYR